MLESGLNKAIESIFSRTSLDVSSPKRPHTTECTVDQPPRKKVRRLVCAFTASAGHSLEQPFAPGISLIYYLIFTMDFIFSHIGAKTYIPSNSTAPISNLPSVSVSNKKN